MNDDKSWEAFDRLTSDDQKWIDIMRKELFWKLDMAKNRSSVQNVNSRIDVFDKLVRMASRHPPHVRAGGQGMSKFTAEYVKQIAAYQHREGCHTSGDMLDEYAAHLARQPKVSEEDVARLFHDEYERLAPSFGYETREETKVFDAGSANGKLMIAVCRNMCAALTAVWHNRPAQEKATNYVSGRMDSTGKFHATAQEKAEPVAFIITDAKGKKFTIYNQLLAEAMRHIAKEKGSTLRVDAVCKIPDFGWFCTRGEGHEGPCAAWPNSPTETCPTCGGPATRHEVSGAFDMRDEYRAAPPPAAGVPDVGPRHPVVVYWRNAALESAAGVVDRYAEHFPECRGASDDIRAMLSATPSPTIGDAK